MVAQKPKVLVVDDEKIIRDFFSKLLSMQGMEVTCAEDGYKALELAKQEKFSIFFVDVRMPGMNGVDTFRQLRKIDPLVKVVLMTGYAVEELLQQAQSEGIYGSIRKPFDIGELKNILNNAISGSKKAAMNILVVDDDPAVISFFSSFLKAKNLKHRAVLNRDEALLAAKQEKFDLVFLDLVLKDESGVDIYKEIKEILPDANIVIITGFPQKLEEVRGNMDMAGCLYKPFDIDSIIKYIDGLK